MKANKFPFSGQPRRLSASVILASVRNHRRALRGYKANQTEPLSQQTEFFKLFWI